MKAAWRTAPGRGGHRAAATWVSAGRILFGASLVGLGILQMAETGMRPALGPVPEAWSIVAATVQLAAGVSLAGAGPRLFKPGDARAGVPEALVGAWAALFMAAALSALAVLFAVQARTGALPQRATTSQPSARIC